MQHCPTLLRKCKISLGNLVLATKRSMYVQMTVFFFWNDKAKLNRCPKCNVLRYKTTDDRAIMKFAYSNPVAVKILRHFPLVTKHSTKNYDILFSFIIH